MRGVIPALRPASLLSPSCLRSARRSEAKCSNTDGLAVASLWRRCGVSALHSEHQLSTHTHTHSDGGPQLHISAARLIRYKYPKRPGEVFLRTETRLVSV